MQEGAVVREAAGIGMKRVLGVEGGCLPAIGMVLLATIAWTVVEYLGSWVPPHYSPFQTVWMRYSVHLLLLAVALGPRRALRATRTRRAAAQILCSLTMLAMPTCFVLALSSLGRGQVWAVFWTSPLMAMAFGRIMLKERPSRGRWLATALGLMGAILVAGPGRDWDARGGLFAFGMAACFALYLVLARSLSAESIPSKLLYTALGVWLALCVFVPGLWVRPTPRALLAWIGIGGAGLLLLWAFDRALELAPVSLVAPLVLSQTIWHVGSTFVTGNRPSCMAMLGALAVAGAIAAVAHDEARRSGKLEPEAA
jgi:drug/metabolite transporter (DMT)-like permease